MLVTVLEGEGRRASMVKAVTKRAGFASAEENPVAFTVRLSETSPPPPPLRLEVAERTQWDAVVTWYPPALENSDPAVTCYSIELSTAGSSGTYRQFEEIWQGMAKELMVEEPCYGQQQEGDNDKSARWPSSAGGGDDDDDDAPPKGPPLSYVLNCHKDLIGRLRIRCWNAAEARPSAFSEEAKLPRFPPSSHIDYFKPQDRIDLERARLEHYGPRPTRPAVPWSCAGAADDERGGKKTGFGSMTGGKKGGGKKGAFVAPIPYDVPAPPDVEGLDAAVAELVAFYEEAGAVGGGRGALLGVHIDHVLLAVAAGRTTVPLTAPLMVLGEVVYADVLLPMLDTVVVCQVECSFALEKVVGIVAQVGSMAAEYAKCVAHVRRVVLLLLELGETMRQCEDDMLLALHLQDADYSKALRRELKNEVVDAVIGVLWRLSTELLKMQLYVRHGARANTQHPLATGGEDTPGGGGGRDAMRGRMPEGDRLQFIAHVQEAVGRSAVKKKARFSLHGSDTMSKRYMKWFKEKKEKMKEKKEKTRGAGSAGGRTAAVLPAGWESKVDRATGVTYYCHAARGVTQWEFPAA